MITLHYCIQCTDKQSGNVATFAYDKQRFDCGNGFYAISPLFACVSEFFTWAKEQGWKSDQYGLGFTMTKDAK
jgi:hypothetical protein